MGLELNTKVLEISEKTAGELKVVDFHIDKGGTGKTTHSYNFAGFCGTVLNKRTLVIDGDRSRNLTKTYGVKGELTITEIFKPDGKLPIYHTNNPNIDIILGDANFTDEGANSRDWSTKYLEFYYWLEDNYDYLSKHYDIIVIDTHNDTSQSTYNLLVGSDVVVNILKPDTNSYDALYDYSDQIEKILPLTKVRNGRNFTYGYDARRLILINDVKFNGLNVSRPIAEFLDEVEKEADYIGLVSNNKLFLESALDNRDIFELYSEMKEGEKKKVQSFVSNLSELYQTIYYEACKKCLEKIN